MDPYLEFLRDWFREAGELFFKRVEVELWKFAEPFYAWLHDLFEHPTPDWRESLETFLAGQAAEGRTVTPESYTSIVAYLEWWAATNRWPAAQPEMSGSLSLAQIGPHDDLQLDGTRAGAEIRFGPSDDFGLPELPEANGPGVLGELLDPELPPLVRSAAAYRKSQIEAHGDSPLKSALIRFNEAINRYGWGIEDRHEELESPSERTANDLADLAFVVADLAGAAAGAMPGKQPTLALKSQPIRELSRNADIATELARRAAARGLISKTPQAFGSRSHLYFRRLNERLDRRLVAERSSFRVSAEEFRGVSGELVPRHSKGSVGADVVVRDARNPSDLEMFDLKTHGGTPRTILSSRQAEFKKRFGVSAQEINRQR